MFMEELLKLCKCGVYLNVNEHRDYYQTVEEFLKDNEELKDIEEDIYNKMVELDSIIRLQFYPTTPIGCYTLYHYNYREIIKQAIKLLI